MRIESGLRMPQVESVAKGMQIFSKHLAYLRVIGATFLALTMPGCTQVSDLIKGIDPEKTYPELTCLRGINLAEIRRQLSNPRVGYRDGFDGETEVWAYEQAACDPPYIFDNQVRNNKIFPCPKINPHFQLTWGELGRQLRAAGYDGEGQKWRGTTSLKVFARTARECKPQ